jgi:chitin disaccharide deacetylase
MSLRAKSSLALLGTVATIAMVLAGGRAAGPLQERYLIIHTDDAGFCEAVNVGTMDGFERGVVSSTSILVVCPGFEEFARYAVAHPEYDYGVHLVLTCESNQIRWGPVLKKEVPSLIQPDGSFWRKQEEVAKHARIEDVRRELRAQVQRALDRGIPISHLDHHMWVLLQRPDLLQAYVELGLEFKLPIRLHRTHTPEECGATLQNKAKYDELIQPIVAKGNPLIDFIEADNYGVQPQAKQAYFLTKLKQLKPGVSEFVIHCSVNRPGMVLPGAADRREADTRTFTSQKVKDEIRRLGIRVISWKELSELRRQGKAG